MTQEQKKLKVQQKSVTYAILCYGKMRQKIGQFTIEDFWRLRNKQPDIPSKLKPNFEFLVRYGYLEQTGSYFKLTLEGENEMTQCSQRRREADGRNRIENGRNASTYKWNKRRGASA